MNKIYKGIIILISLLFSTISYSDTENLIIWGPPVAPTVLLDVAATHGKAKDITPFEVKTWKNIDALRAGLANNSIKASIIPSNLASILFNKGRDIKFTTVMTQGLLYVVSKSGDIVKLSDLNHKKIIMPFKGDVPELVLTILADKADVMLHKTYASTPTEAVNLFLSKDFDVALLPEPAVTMIMSKAKQQGIELKRAINIQDEWNKTFNSTNGYTQAGLFVTGDFCKNNSKFMQQLQQDLVDAVAWVEANPDAAAELLSKHLSVPKPILAKSFKFSNLSAIDTKLHSKDVFKFYQELLNLNPKVVGGKLPDTNLFSCQ